MKKDFMTRVYRHFSDFTSEASARELEYFILNARYTTAFNERIKEIVESVKKEGREDIEFSILFNTNGEIALVDADVIGRYIGNNYNISIERYYKSGTLNKIVKQVVNGNEKTQMDFTFLSCSTIYKTLSIIYSEIIYKKEIDEKYRKYYSIEEYDCEDKAIVIATILILEDICKYLNISEYILKKCIENMIKKTLSQNE